MFFDKIKNLFQKDKVDVKSAIVTPVADNPVKIKKPRTKKPKKVEPKVEIVKFDFDPKNPKMGSIELDWNKEFIDLLKSNGYMAETDEAIVNRWLSDVCRTIATQEYPMSITDTIRYVQRKDLGDGKAEFS